MICRRRWIGESTMIEVKKVSRYQNGINHVGPMSQNSSLLLSSARISCFSFFFFPSLHFTAVCIHHLRWWGHQCQGFSLLMEGWSLGPKTRDVGSPSSGGVDLMEVSSASVVSLARRRNSVRARDSALRCGPLA